MQAHINTAMSQASKARKICTEWAYSGWWLFAEIAGNHEQKIACDPMNIETPALLAILDQISNYESLHAHETLKPLSKFEELLTPHQHPQIRLLRRAVAHLAGLRMSDYELLCVMEYIAGLDPYFLDGACQKLARVWNSRAIELIEGSELERPLGFMMITLPQDQLNANRKHGWVCHCCFRHSKEKTKYCKKHSPSESPAGWKGYIRRLARYSSKNVPETIKNQYEHFRVSNDYLRPLTGDPNRDVIHRASDKLMWGIGVHNPKTPPNDWNNRVTELTYIREWAWDIGLHNPQPPFDWKERVAKWKTTCPWLPTLLFRSATWTDVVTVLRTALEDDYCLNDDFDLWEAKIHAKSLEYKWLDSLDSAPKKRRLRSSLASRVALLARSPSMTQKKIAERLKISKARVSQIVEDHPGLHHLRREAGRKSGVNMESK